MKPTEALTLLAVAIDAGDLPEDTHVELIGNTVTARLPRTFYRPNFDQDAAYLEVFARLFPDGNRKRAWTHHRGSKAHRTPPQDRAEYRARVDGTLAIFEYSIPHEHVDYRGELHNGKPRWICTGCRQRITITESRRLGLLPTLK